MSGLGRAGQAAVRSLPTRCCLTFVKTQPVPAGLKTKSALVVLPQTRLHSGQLEPGLYGVPGAFLEHSAMTLAAKIMKLYDGKRTTREIADTLGCRIEYVRVVARQRKGGTRSEIDRRWAHSPLGRATLSAGMRKKYATPEGRAYYIAYNAEYRRSGGDTSMARRAANAAKARARASTQSAEAPCG